MEFYHEPIMLNECMEYLLTNKNGLYVDGTLGGGGHTEAILKGTEYGKVIGVDLDLNAIDSSIERLSNYKGRILTIHENFHNIKNIVSELGIHEVDGVLYDLGVSSFQLDCTERGFSYQHDAPLDMRMNKSQDFSAFDVVNKYDENRLFEIIKDYGEENWARRIAKYIVEYREKEPIETTGKLVEIIKNAIPAKARRNGPHPAKRTFQAIRIEVNNELDPLKKTLEDTIDVLKPGGRLCVITFHSLEDRIVKHTFKQMKNPCTCPPDIPVCICGKKPKIDIITGKPIVPSDDELDRNPRARSAKLRVAEKL